MLPIQATSYAFMHLGRQTARQTGRQTNRRRETERKREGDRQIDGCMDRQMVEIRSDRARSD